MRCGLCDTSASSSHWHSENRIEKLKIGWSLLCRRCFAFFEFYSTNGHHRVFMCGYYASEVNA
jgi:hypothetical protein